MRRVFISERSPTSKITLKLPSVWPRFIHLSIQATPNLIPNHHGQALPGEGADVGGVQSVGTAPGMVGLGLVPPPTAPRTGPAGGGVWNV